MHLSLNEEDRPEQITDVIARLRADSASPTLGEPPMLDLQQIESLRSLMGDEDLQALFVDALGALCAGAVVLSTGLDASRIRAEAHKMKGTAGTLGMAAVYRTTTQIEVAAAEDRREEDAIGRLQAQFAATIQALRSSGLRL